MKNVMYFIGFMATLSVVFGGIIHFFGNRYGDIAIVAGAAVTIVCMFVIDYLSFKTK